MSMTKLYVELEEEFGKPRVDAAMSAIMSEPYDSLLTPIMRYDRVRRYLDTHKPGRDPFFNAHGERVASLPSLLESLAEVETQLATVDCPHRDMLERMRDRLREATKA